MPLNMAPSFLANGDISPCRFVKQDTSAGVRKRVLQCGLGERMIGITDKYTRRHDDPLHAKAGEPVTIYGIGEVCHLQIGVGGAQEDSLLESDSTGRGVIAAGVGENWIGAISLEERLVDEMALVYSVLFPKTI